MKMVNLKTDLIKPLLEGRRELWEEFINVYHFMQSTEGSV